MGERSKHTSMSPDLQRLLNHSSIPYRNLSWNLQRNPSLLAHKVSSQESQQPPNSSPASSVVAPNAHSSPRKQNHVSLLAGLIRCTSQVATATAVAPIEQIHILMQCQNEMLKYGHLSSPYKGMKDCFLRTIKHEGVLSLWRGNSMNVIASLMREVILPITPGSLSSGCIPLDVMLRLHFLYPLKFARIHLANDVKATRQLHFSLDSTKRSFINDGVGNRKFSGAFDVLNKTLKSQGIIGLYRGYIPACLGAIGSHLSINWLKSAAKQNKEQGEKLHWPYYIIPIVVLFVGIDILPYLLLMVSRRMVMTSGEGTKYKGVVDAFRQIIKHDGVSSLFKRLRVELRS